MEQRTTGPSGAPGGAPTMGNPITSINYSGATTFSEDGEYSGTSYESTTGAQNALLISGGVIDLVNATVVKSGDDNGGDESDFYGTNAAILVYNGATLNMNGGTVQTNGGHANAIFAYGTGVVNISSTTIETSSNNSGGIMVAGGGTISADALTVETSGNSAAAIRSDRGGGEISVTGGTYITHGVGSPAIYSTANVKVTEATLSATASEGVVIEGMNSVSLDSVNMTVTNNQNNGHSETFKSIFIYQSMSGDASEGMGTFTAKDSIITTNSGDHFFITNTTAEINLSGNKFTQNDKTGAFLRAQAGYWGNTGANGGIATLNTEDQNIIGDIITDNISTVTLNLKHSYLKGAFTGNGTVNLNLSANSIVVLTGDSNITSLTNEDANNLNIYANGYKLYVGGEEATINQSEAPASFLTDSLIANCIGSAGTNCVQPVQQEDTTTGQSAFPVWGYFAIGGGVIIIMALIAFAITKMKHKKNGPTPTQPITMAPSTPMPGSPVDLPTTPTAPEVSETPNTPDNPDTTNEPAVPEQAEQPERPMSENSNSTPENPEVKAEDTDKKDDFPPAKGII
ncbi:hypothetical protein IK112_01950 [Candidatus Saccharibacteria bacterium]|nr:hypothetical protein [Candidatus Saccharibacteria bacterium]